MIGPIPGDASEVTVTQQVRRRRRLPFGWLGNISGAVSTIGWGVYLKTTAANSWNAVGWWMGAVGGVVFVGDCAYTFISVHRRDTSAIPNLAEIQEALERANEIAEVY